MLKTIEGIVDENGQIKLTEPVKLNRSQRVLVTVLETEEEFVNGVPVTTLLSEPGLSDWNRPEEDGAWKDRQN